MFKKIVSIAIAAMMLGSTAAIAATAAEDGSAVAAADAQLVILAGHEMKAAAVVLGDKAEYFEENVVFQNLLYQ